MALPIIIHVHVYKNAGTSVIAAFRRNFGDRVAELEPDDPERFLDDRTVEEYLRKHPDTVMVSSHRIRMPLPARLAGRDVLPLVFLRDPIDRLSSVYRFERREGQKGAIAALSRTTDFPGLVSTLLTAGLGSTIADVQSQLCGSPADIPEGALLGLVERFSESMALIEHRLHQWYPRCDLAGSFENVTRPRGQLQADVQQTLDDLGPELVGKLLHLNARDVALYRFFAAHIDDRLRDRGGARYAEQFRAREHASALGSAARQADAVGPDCPSLTLHKVEGARTEGKAANRHRGEFAMHYQASDAGPVDSTGTIAIRGFRFACACGDGLPVLCPQETVRFEMTVEWLRPVATPVVGFTIRDRSGRVVWCMNTFWTKAPLESVREPQTCVYGFTCPLPPLIGGLYTIDVDTALGAAQSVQMLVSRREAAAFGVAAHYDPVPGGVVFVRDIALEQRRTH